MVTTIACRKRVKMSRMAGIVSNSTSSRIQGAYGIRLPHVLAQLERGYGDERERGGHDRDGQQVEEAAASEVVVSDRQSDGQDESRKAESRERDHRTP